MRLILLILFCSLLLSACVVSPAITIKPDQIYQGYPCRDHCEGFKKGYDQAQAQHTVSKSTCTGKTEAEKLGCQAYVTDYTYATSPDPGLMP